MGWYALITISGEEESTCQIIKKTMNLHVIYPRAERHFRTKGTDLLVIKPFIAGCILIESDWEYYKVMEGLHSAGIEVVGLQRLPHRTIDVIMKLLSSNHIIKMSKGRIQDHQTVVYEGALIGLESYIRKINRHKRLAVLDFDILEKDVLIGLEIVEKR